MWAGDFHDLNCGQSTPHSRCDFFRFIGKTMGPLVYSRIVAGGGHGAGVDVYFD